MSEINTKPSPTLPTLLDFEKPTLKELHKEIESMTEWKNPTKAQLKTLESKKVTYLEKLKSIYKNLTHWERSQVARHPQRPYLLDYIDMVFTNFIELHGDRKFADDPSFVCGFAKLKGQSVVIVGNQKDRKNPLSRNFGMGNPEGYRKALRIFQLADKFKLPIITFIDTPGAYPGKEGEDRGQGEAIAYNLSEMFSLSVPIVCVVVGEGGSGGALGIGVGNRILMLENSIYSVISPESFASIIWHDASRKEEAASALKNDPKTSLKYKLIDEIIKEPIGGAHRDWEFTSKKLSRALVKNLGELKKLNGKELIKQRQNKFAEMGEFTT